MDTNAAVAFTAANPGTVVTNANGNEQTLVCHNGVWTVSFPAGFGKVRQETFKTAGAAERFATKQFAPATRFSAQPAWETR